MEQKNNNEPQPMEQGQAAIAANPVLAAAAGDFKPSKKHLAIFKRIAEKGFYKPTYSDKEPATMTLEKKGIAEWRDDFRGVKLTVYGKELVKVNGW